MGAIAGGVSAWAISNSIIGRAERIEALAAALRAHRQPIHVIPDDGDVMGRAERSLLQATDAVIAEIGALTEQRDELDAILRSMTEAVVVTGARGEVILLNGQARKTFALSADANYQGRDFVELCRDPRLQEFVASSTGSPNGEIAAAEVRIAESFAAIPCRQRRAGASVGVGVGMARRVRVPRHHATQDLRDDARGFHRQPHA